MSQSFRRKRSGGSRRSPYMLRAFKPVELRVSRAAFPILHLSLDCWWTGRAKIGRIRHATRSVGSSWSRVPEISAARPYNRLAVSVRCDRCRAYNSINCSLHFVSGDCLLERHRTPQPIQPDPPHLIGGIFQPNWCCAGSLLRKAPASMGSDRSSAFFNGHITAV